MIIQNGKRSCAHEFGVEILRREDKTEHNKIKAARKFKLDPKKISVSTDFEV